jgi:hypothetical protein
MGIGFKAGEYNRAAGTRDAFGALSDDLVREGHPPMVSISGDREIEGQLVIWYQRMVPVGQENGRRVYARVKWNGITWSRIHPDTVAIPDASNHVKRRANDLAWPYNSVTTAHLRARELAKRHNITCEGLGFREPWHWTYWGPLGSVGAAASASVSRPAAAAAPTPKGSKMTAYARRDTDGKVMAFPEGGKVKHFISPEEYNRHRNNIAILNGVNAAIGAPLLALPPALDGPITTRIVTMNQANISLLQEAQGAFN